MRAIVTRQHTSRGGAARALQFAHVVEGEQVTTSQIAKRIGIHEETALRRARRGPYPLTWEGLAIHGRNMQ
jgi:hypothetical protein